MTQNIEMPRKAIDTYIERRKKDLIDCQAALAKLDFKILEVVGHQVKGNAAMFGFDDLGAIGEALEDSALSKDQVKSEATLVRFSNYLKQLEKTN